MAAAPVAKQKALRLTFVASCSFVGDQEADEEKEAGDAKNQGQGKIKASDGGRRVEDVIPYTLPYETDEQGSHVDPNQSKKSLSCSVAPACSDKSQASEETEEGKGDIGIPGVERSGECAGEGIPKHVPKERAAQSDPGAESGREEGRHDQAEPQRHVQQTQSTTPKCPERLVLRGAKPIVDSGLEEEVDEIDDQAKEGNTYQQRYDLSVPHTPHASRRGYCRRDFGGALKQARFFRFLLWWRWRYRRFCVWR